MAGADPPRRIAFDTAVAVDPACFSAASPPHSQAAAPVIEIGGLELGLGGLLKFLRITALSIVLLGLGGMVSWTTNVAEIAPAVAKLGRPLRALRVPVDDWAVALSLALRAFPMLIDEFRILYAARSLRPKAVLTRRRDRDAGGHWRWST